MTNLAPHRSWSWWTRVGVATGALALVVVLGRVLVMTPSAEAHAEATFTLIHSFRDSPDGSEPYAGLIRDGAGNFYGTTEDGGFSSWGTVFKLDATGRETVLYNFTSGSDGSQPHGALVRDADGNLYGTTSQGGGSGCAPYNGCGTVFKLDPTGTETVLYRFTGGADGEFPSGSLVRDPAGNLYGTTIDGGSSDFGTVFKLDTTGTKTVLHSFTGYPDGNWPWAGLVRDAAGNFYGTTTSGGTGCATYGCGTVFKLDPNGVETVLYSFAGGVDDGRSPQAELIRDAAGNLYGTTYAGGGGVCPNGCGTVFKLDMAGTETVLHRFRKNPDARSPAAGLIRDAAGNLYGTTYYGGGGHSCSDGCGTVFQLDPSGTATLLYSFTGRTDGKFPYAGLVRDSAGNLYGTTTYGGYGGNPGHGTVFKLSH